MGDQEIVEVDGRFKPRLLPLHSRSPPPPLFNGIPRLYISLTCPYAQRVWIARNFKELDNIELIPIDLTNRPQWFVEKISPSVKVPALEHRGRVKVESLELLQYLDNNFSGPKLFPLESPKREATIELLRNAEYMNQRIFHVLRNKDVKKVDLDKNLGPILDQLELALGRFNVEGPYFLGTITGVDFAYVPFVERFHIILQELFGYNILERRPKLYRWFSALNQLDAYTSTKVNPRVVINDMKKTLGR